MGLGKKWTAEDYAQLREEWGLYSIPTLANRMGRTVKAIKIKAVRLKLGGVCENSDKIPFNHLLQALGIYGSYAHWLKRFAEAGLIITYQKVIHKRVRMVDIDQFWDFAEKNKNLIDFSRVEKNILGIEPQWVDTKRSEDIKRSWIVKPHNAAWSLAEDAELSRLVGMYSYSYSEISQRLNRSEGAVAKRIVTLGLKGRPVKADNHDLWTQEQLSRVCALIKCGSSYENISADIGKSSKAIRGLVFRMYLTENLSKVCKMIGDGDWGNNRPARIISQKRVMSASEKQNLKTEINKLVNLLAYKIRDQFDTQDNWQRYLCKNWDDTKGCLAGETNCDSCVAFSRLQPRYCVRCGASFYERTNKRMCERCRLQRKKQGYLKYLKLQQRNGVKIEN